MAQTPHEADGFAAALAQLPENEMDMAALARATETHLWRVPRLWALAEALLVEFIRVDTLIWHFDTARWLRDDEPPTVRAIVDVVTCTTDL